MVLVWLALTLVSMLVAVYLPPRLEIKGNIAYVAGNGAVVPQSRWCRIDPVEQIPPMSQLVRNKYDAVVVAQGGGQLQVITIKNESFRRQLEQALRHPDTFIPDASSRRGVGTNITGYLVLFLLLAGLQFMGLYTEDKAGGTFRRTVTSPIGIHGYLAGQLLFNVLVVFVPAYALLIMLRAAFRIEIGFTYAQYALLLGLLTALATTFSLFMTSAIEKDDNTMALASSIILLTSLLSTSFFPYQHGGAVMKFITNLLPQKRLMHIVQGLEQGRPLAEMTGHIGYVALVSLAFCTAGWWICQRRFGAGRY